MKDWLDKLGFGRFNAMAAAYLNLNLDIIINDRELPKQGEIPKCFYYVIKNRFENVRAMANKAIDEKLALLDELYAKSEESK